MDPPELFIHLGGAIGTTGNAAQELRKSSGSDTKKDTEDTRAGGAVARQPSEEAEDWPEKADSA